MRAPPPLVTGLAGFATTLGLALGFEVLDGGAHPELVPRVAEPSSFFIGAPTPQGLEELFPLERYVIEGETEWLPLLLQWDDPSFLEGDKRDCLARLAEMPDDGTCPVEYDYWIDEGRVRGVEAIVFSEDPRCGAYVECRLPGLLGATLDLPAGEFATRPVGLRLVDKVQHASRTPSPAERTREIEELTATAARADAPGSTGSPQARRLRQYLHLSQEHRLEFLLRGGPPR